MVGAALGVIMAIIMIHHMESMSTHVAALHGGMALCGATAPMPGMAGRSCAIGIPGVGPAAWRWGNSEALVISHALMPSPAPVTT
jgi:hypothetical protein